MHAQHSKENTKGLFQIVDGTTIAGDMTYSDTGNGLIIIDHTDVNPEYKGQGIGKLLVLEAVKYARENDIKIIPVCPFAKSVFEKLDEIKDVLK
jgi:predicted GNAT family acetyltransferase